MFIISKKRYLTIFFLLISTTVFAQKSIFKKPKFAAGFKGIVTYPTVSFDPAISQSLFQTTGYGLIFKHITEKNLGLQLEINNTNKGWTETFNGEDLYKRELQYLEIPLMTYLYFGKRKVQLFVTFGTQINYLLDENTVPLGNVDDQRNDYFDRDVNKWVWDFAAGGGINVITPIGHFQIEGKFSRSITNVFRRPDRTSTETSFLQATNLSIAYLIPISGWKEEPVDNSNEIQFKTD